MRLTFDLPSRLARSVFALTLLWSWSGVPTSALAREQDDRTAAAAATRQAARSPDPAQLKKAFARVVSAVEKVERSLRRDSFEPSAVVETVGREPTKLFEWVRDKTYWVPYRGLLRGDRGVLMERIGNSLDRSLLLYTLLKCAGHDVQLVHAQLTAAQASELLAKLPPVPMVPAAATSATQPVGRPASAEQQLLRDRIDMLVMPTQRLAEDLAQRVAEQTPAVLEAIGPSIPQRDREAERSAAVEALRDHWWVQVRTGASLQDLDPLLPGAQMGLSLAAASRTIRPDQLTDLGEANLHLVQIQVFVEYLEKGRVREIPVLTQKILPAAVVGQRIAISNVPMAWPQDLDAEKAKEPVAAIKAAVLDQREWMPVLQVGQQKVARYTFDDNGMTNDATLPGYVQAVARGRAIVRGVDAGASGTGNAVGGMLGSGRIGDTGAKSRNETDNPKHAAATAPSMNAELTAEWIDYQIQVPGQGPPQRVRRQIFDLLGPSARAAGQSGNNPIIAPGMTETRRLRRGLALMGETEILPLVGRFSREYLVHLLCQDVLRNRQATEALLDLKPGDDIKTLEQQAVRFEQMPTELIMLAMARQMFSGHHDSVYLDCPNIFTLHRSVDLNRASGDLVGCVGMDIVTNDVAVLPSASVDPFRVRVEQGIFDTNAEALLEGGCARVESTADMFALATARDGWMTLRDPDDPAWQQANFPKDFKARVKADLSPHCIVLAPKTPVRLGQRWTAGWWHVNLSTGQTLGMGARGWGQTATEKLVITAAVGAIVLAACVVGGIREHSAFKGVTCFLGMSLCIGVLVVLFLLTWPAFVAWLAEATAGGIVLEAMGSAEALELAESLKFFCELAAVGSIPGDLGWGGGEHGGGEHGGGEHGEGGSGQDHGDGHDAGGSSGAGGSQAGRGPGSSGAGSSGSTSGSGGKIPDINDYSKRGYPIPDISGPIPDYHDLRDFDDNSLDGD